MRFLSLALCALLILPLAACQSTGGRAPDDPPIVGLAEAQTLEGEGDEGPLDGSVGDPADALEEQAALSAPTGGGGLFAALFRRGGGSDDTPEVEPGTTLPFGQVAEVCGVSARSLGTEVDAAPKEGRARFALIDPAPQSTALRTQYVTGFSDRCARQFTGALVLFGSPDVHETNRYAPGNRRAYTATDTAYEKLKSRVCGVKPQTPCPADRADRIQKAAVFVTVYPQFGTSNEWFELLLSDGRILAYDMTGS
ncbi:hypothetical protein [Oceaniglobus roseus]|uniref:hypothetical protein n=1 Tax=Oceaniglobus roseus TaxID=1737570 RepID=UPI000C7E8843|nr:hypothetical protein [Kandeliimicrobium roseum]